ncbi:MAG TPA: hypothetical protein VLA43_14590 [Longimicrobiales bacterium]|nr:hypothetical protein [Longimicrobiales bacterium]
MTDLRVYRKVFLVAAAYDLVLGVAFLFLYPWVYGLLGIGLPSEPAYLQTSAAFVVVQGIMYLLIAREMTRNRDLILVGAIYKAAYAGISLYHWTLGDLPHVVFAVFGLLDIVFLVAFVMCLGAMGRATPAEAS